MLPPRPRKPHHLTEPTLADKAKREAELAKALRANLRRRKVGKAGKADQDQGT